MSSNSKKKDGGENVVSFNAHRNTKTKIKTFGNIELKFISVGDMEFIIRSEKIEDPKLYVARVLHHQLISPKVTFSKFNELSKSKLIKIAKEFIKNDPGVFKYFKETTEKEFFINFKKAIKKYNRESHKQFKILSKSILSSQKILTNFNKNYTELIKPTIYASSYISEKLHEITKLNQQYLSRHLVEARSLKPIIDQHQSFTKILSEQLGPQIEYLKSWVEKSTTLFYRYDKYWQTFKDKYEIAEEEAISLLKKYNWFISPSMPLDLVFQAVKIGRKKGNMRKDMNNLFINHFISNNYEELERLVDGWKKNVLFKKRMKILRDCVNIMKNSDKGYNSSNLLIPTLIAQIDGVRIDFMKKNGLSFWTDDEKWKMLFRDQTKDWRLLDLANDIFLNILFQKSLPGKPLESPFTLNRHKIMHGEYLNYGRIDNTIRSFLILDFLVNLKLNKSGM